MTSPPPRAPHRKINPHIQELIIHLLRSDLSNPKIITPPLPTQFAISLRQQFYKWRRNVLNTYNNPTNITTFQYAACDKYLALIDTRLTTNILERIMVQMDPILSTPSATRQLIWSFIPSMEVKQVNPDGTLSEVSLLNPAPLRLATYSFPTSPGAAGVSPGASPAPQAPQPTSPRLTTQDLYGTSEEDD